MTESGCRAKTDDKFHKMKLDVLADLDHLFMINFSVEATRLWALLPGHLRLLTREGRAFPSIVLPAIRNLRQRSIGFPKVDYDLFGLRILVEYESSQSVSPRAFILAASLWIPITCGEWPMC
jgi:hypothetical protein